MKLSTRARYGLRALIDLGVYSDMGVTSIQSIAQRQKISVSYLEQLMAKLKRAGFVESIRGAGGGYRFIHRIAGAVKKIAQIHAVREADGSSGSFDNLGKIQKHSFPSSQSCSHII